MRLPASRLTGGTRRSRRRGGHPDRPSAAPPDPLTLSPERSGPPLRAEIERAGGREVCFLADGGRGPRGPRIREPSPGAASMPCWSRPGMPRKAASCCTTTRPAIWSRPRRTCGSPPSSTSRGLGTAIVDNQASRIYVVVEPPSPRRRVPLDEGSLAELLAPGGALSGRHEGYEDRPGQREMLEEVVRRFNDGGVAILEAGTGTGKSLAYLVPAAVWAQENKERTIVSTNTINLQEQLAGRTCLWCKQLVGEIRWALVKGRGNYISIRRALLASESQASLFEEDRSDEMARLLEWIDRPRTAPCRTSRSLPADETWEEVRSDPDMCLRARCPPLPAVLLPELARRTAASAELLVVNHHLLFTDLAVRRATQNYTQSAVLPAVQARDPGRGTQRRGRRHVASRGGGDAQWPLSSPLPPRPTGTWHPDGRTRGAGWTEGPELRERVENRVRPALGSRSASSRAWSSGSSPSLPGDGWPCGSGTGRDRGAGGADGGGRGPASTLSALGTLERELAELRSRLELVEEFADRLEGRILDLRSIERRLAAAEHGLRLVLAPGEEGAAYVRWLDSRGRGSRSNLVLAAAPIELGGRPARVALQQAETTILTSATLTTRKTVRLPAGPLGPTGAARTVEDDNRLDRNRAYHIVTIRFFIQHLALCPNRPSRRRRTGSGVPGGHGEGRGGGRGDERWWPLRPVHFVRSAAARCRLAPGRRRGRALAPLRTGGGGPLRPAPGIRGGAGCHPSGHVLLLGRRRRARRSHSAAC